MTGSPILEVTNLSKQFDISGPFSRSRQSVHAVDGVSLQVDRRETLAIVGESGCGKTTLGLLPHRRKLQMVFQDPFGSLKPRMTVQETIGDLLRIHGLASPKTIRQGVGEATRFCRRQATTMTRRVRDRSVTSSARASFWLRQVRKTSPSR